MGYDCCVSCAEGKLDVATHSDSLAIGILASQTLRKSARDWGAASDSLAVTIMADEEKKALRLKLAASALRITMDSVSSSSGKEADMSPVRSLSRSVSRSLSRASSKWSRSMTPDALKKAVAAAFTSDSDGVSSESSADCESESASAGI